MTLQQLRILLTVYQTGSITKASEKLFLSQPSISIAIKEVEKSYHQLIFERYSRRLRVTPFGIMLCQYASRILSLYDEMDQAANRNASTGSIRIGAGTTVGQILLPGAICSFKKLYPDVDVTVTIDRVSGFRQQLIENQLDFVIAESGLVDPVLISVPLFDSPIVVVCHKDNPLAGKTSVCAHDFTNADILTRQKGSYIREMTDYYFDLHNISITPKWESIDGLALINAVRKNLGISFLPLTRVHSIQDDNLVVLNVSDFSATYHQNLYYHKDKTLSPLMFEFIKSITEIHSLNF